MSTIVTDNISKDEQSSNTSKEDKAIEISSSSVDTAPTDLPFSLNSTNTSPSFPSLPESTTAEVQNDITQTVPTSTSNHSQRRVHFPIDDTQLTKVSEAPIPLSNQPFVPLKNVLRIYLDTCTKSQIKPLQTIIEQLSTINDERQTFHDRIARLSIINEKLNTAHLNALEEILARVQFYTLEFESSLYEDSLISSLFDIIEYYESCIHLNLSANRSMSLQGYQALGRYMRKTHVLQRLDMNHMKFEDNNILIFGRCLRFSSNLYELHLESCQLNGKMLQKLIIHIRSCNCLRELHLGDNRLHVQDSLIICDLIRTCGHFLNLLDLKTNSLQDNGLSHISSQLSQYDEYHVQQNVIQKLNLQSNQISHQGIGYLAKALLHNRTIKSLNLSNNNLTNEGLFILRDSLLTNRTISELILGNCKLTCQAAIALAEYVAESSVIRHIDLRGNNIQVSGIMALALGMKHNKSLINVELDPVTPTQTNGGVLSNQFQTNNIDSSTSGLLSFSSFRRMTLGFGQLTGGLNQNSEPLQDSKVKEFLQQKSKWINDINEICRKNKEKQRELEEQERQKEETRVEQDEKKEYINEGQEETMNEKALTDEEQQTAMTSLTSTVDPELLNGKVSQKFVSPLPSPLLSPVDDLSPFLVKKIFTNQHQPSSVVPLLDHDQSVEQTSPSTNTNDTIESDVVHSTTDNDSTQMILSETSEINNPTSELRSLTNTDTTVANEENSTISTAKSPFTIDDYDNDVDENIREEKDSNNTSVDISDIHFDSNQHETHSTEMDDSEKKGGEDDIYEYNERIQKPFYHSDSLFLLRNKTGDLDEHTTEDDGGNNLIISTNQTNVPEHQQQLID
ncbi:unnamed protein product [Didymodactylos carnosus]|uniref:Uncharacterized protein n=1 Tax=Didymodactylos carnosus TaxID=1234261 RepID=A0A8S2EMY7_9BILA|nr:unnamed protein product [Didymodactylos carnosus]CAF4034247.1 unnamed protein product [Didymodactylos carnosus]